MIRFPKINFNFWVLMILATTIGEIVGNLISRNMELGYTTGSIILISTYIIVLTAIIFMKPKNYIFYWMLILLGNIAGTNCADFITIEPLKLGTIFGSLLVMAVLSAILIVWKITAKTLSITEGLTNKTAFLYWFAILVSSTFGTTSGDFLSNDTSLGAGGGSILLIIILGIILLLTRYTKIPKEICYWLALVLIHPIGATIGNYISKPAGLNFGNIWTSMVLVAFFAFLFLLKNKKEIYVSSE